ncbi:diaminopimelate epimerase [Acidihalobacter ferrooxydans]|uniref:Diaminopimelate epimerase n=1 Tax=Acidihalobacter ferrooxydans TaxID=1765967 RepID=A0A1P8UDI8_9GAMM|nr:diaminopimelate epimerase [Acidihalobacter ferrooxydans]APZ41927.1 diaminopimelate epimerase [Acidihalobacter ferrooxydans]
MDLSGLRFTKMHGLGNDFVVIDAVRQSVRLDTATVRALAERHRGVGCDQLLIVEPAQGGQADLRYRIFNADGGEVEQCGNGARCFARFVVDQGLAKGPEIRVETLGGLMTLRLLDDGQVTVNMGVRRLEPAQIPFEAAAMAPGYPLTVDGATYEIGAVSMGNPHAVLRVADIDTAPVAALGPLIEAHPRFPQRVNAGFMQVLSPAHIRLRVYERGAGETQACGSGACAAVVSGRVRGWLAPRVAVDVLGGRLMIEWQGTGEPVLMTGPATTVFEGRITDEPTHHA